jgi:hypothetical protein
MFDGSRKYAMKSSVFRLWSNDISRQIDQPKAFSTSRLTRLIESRTSFTESIIAIPTLSRAVMLQVAHCYTTHSAIETFHLTSLDLQR